MPKKDADQFGISVVCPTYNSHSYILRTINSILYQKDLPEQVVFSDDGSKDDTIQLIESMRGNFEQSGIQLHVINNNHKGPGAARNHGVIKASQRWVAFLDADDIWKDNKIYFVRKIMRVNPSSNCFLHWEEYVKINGERQLLKHGVNKYNSSISLLPQLFRTNFLSTSAIVCKKQLIEDSGGFDITLPNAQDYELWLRISPKINLTIIQEILGEYIEESESITARPYYKRFRSELRIALRYRKKVNLTLFLYKVTRIILSRQWFYSLFNLLIRTKKHSN